MSVGDVDIHKVGKVLFLGCIVWSLAALSIWAAGADWLLAVKTACGVAVGWVSGNLAETGMIVPAVPAK